MRVIHLPTNTGGNSWGLAQAEKELGLESHVLYSYNNWLNYESDILLDLDPARYKSLKNRLTLLKTFFKIRNKYDIFHFNYGSSLLDPFIKDIQLFDLPFYSKKSGIFVTYNGDDARLQVASMRRNTISQYNNPERCNYVEDLRKKRRIKKFSQYASHIFALNPDLMWFLPEEKTSFLPYTIAGWYNIEKTKSNFANKKIKILHAPTCRWIKGTDIILNVLNKLRKKYPDIIEIILVENIPYNEALKIYYKADLVIDQILAGWYGGFAVDIMKMGKPIAVYIREEDLKFIPKEMKEDLKKSVININPYNIEEVLENYIQNRNFLYEIAQNGYDYVNKWHDPVKTAKKVKEIYEKVVIS